MSITGQERLTDLRNGLLRLHKTLLDSERSVYERDVRKITSTGQLLGLVMDDPWFAWLREISRFVVRIDEKLDAKEPIERTEVETFIRQARQLLTPSETGTGFDRQYYEAMQRDPDVIFAHREVSQLLAKLAE